MTLPFGRGAALIAIVAASAALGGCTRIREHHGQLIDETLVSSVQPGVDNRDSVMGTLGHPTFTGQFDQRDWYYVGRDTQQLAFGLPKPTSQTVLHVRFDENGNVASVERTGLEQVASIRPYGDTTPTLGHDRSFFEELFGNIGQVGAMGAGTPGGSNSGTP